jgi:hypothetical protein
MLIHGLIFKELSTPCAPSTSERRDLEKGLTGRIPYAISPLQHNKSNSGYHTITNTGGISILNKLSNLEEQMTSLTTEVVNLKRENANLRRENQKAIQSSEDTYREDLLILREEIQQCIELNKDLLALRRTGELVASQRDALI